jgi:DNA-directed RNA polymerase subunit beta'
MSELEKVIYFTGYLITDVDEEKKKEYIYRIDKEYETKAQTLDDEKDIEKLKLIFAKIKKDLEHLHAGAVVDEPIHSRLIRKFSKAFKSEIGAEAIYNLAKKTNLEKKLAELEKEFETVSAVLKPKLIKRISIVKSMLKESIRPE